MSCSEQMSCSEPQCRAQSKCHAQSRNVVLRAIVVLRANVVLGANVVLKVLHIHQYYCARHTRRFGLYRTDIHSVYRGRKIIKIIDLLLGHHFCLDHLFLFIALCLSRSAELSGTFKASSSFSGVLLLRRGPRCWSWGGETARAGCCGRRCLIPEKEREIGKVTSRCPYRAFGRH
jgi:hypothetical protein